MSKFRCEGNLKRIGYGCHGCEVTTDGHAKPDRCVFKHGPDVVSFVMVIDGEHYIMIATEALPDEKTAELDLIGRSP